MKYIWVQKENCIQVPELIFNQLEHESALLDAVLMSVHLSHLIKDYENSLKIGDRYLTEEIKKRQQDQVEQVRFISNRWFELRHEARKRGENVPPIL